MLHALLPALHALAPYAAMAIGTWVLNRFRSPRDSERAQLLVAIADSVAATIVASPIGAANDWAQLVKLVTRGIRDVVGPAYPLGALEREATRALVALGKGPNAH